MSWLLGRCCSVVTGNVKLIRKPCTTPTKLCSRYKNIFSGEFSHVSKSKDVGNHGGGETNILYINAGHNEDSVVCLAANELLKKLTKPYKLQKLNLWDNGLPHYDVSHAMAKLRILQNKGTPEDVENFAPMLKMAEDINDVDILIVTTPMWNYSIPYVLKHYIDIVIQPGINFKERPGQSPTAVRPGRPLFLFSSSGGDGDVGRDFLGPYLQVIFNLVGFDRFHHVNMWGMVKGATKEEILLEKRPEIEKMAKGLVVDQVATDEDGVIVNNQR